MSDQRASEQCVSRRCHAMPFRAELSGEGVHFRLWAPEHASISVKFEDTGKVCPMNKPSDGWHEIHAPDARPGTQYRFILPDGVEVPDPASRFQPQDVHGPSEV